LTIESTRQPKNINHNTITIQEADINNIVCVKINCLDVGDLIEYKIKELTFNESNVIYTVYQIHLLVNVDITLNITAKDVDALIVAKIKDEDDYS
ncbi:3046_t:CDS:1, partial [Racocetra persica]